MFIEFLFTFSGSVGFKMIFDIILRLLEVGNVTVSIYFVEFDSLTTFLEQISESLLDIFLFLRLFVLLIGDDDIRSIISF